MHASSPSRTPSGTQLLLQKERAAIPKIDRYGHVVTGAQERVVATVRVTLENAQARLTPGDEAA
jgi:hypothetical protein